MQDYTDELLDLAWDMDQEVMEVGGYDSEISDDDYDALDECAAF